MMERHDASGSDGLSHDVIASDDVMRMVILSVLETMKLMI